MDGNGVPVVLCFTRLLILHLKKILLSKGRTIRKLMGEGGGRSTKKNSQKGKLNEKKFLHAN